MSTSIKLKQLLAATLGACLAACSSPDPVAYSGIASSSQLRPNKADDSARIPYRYATQVDWQTYNRIIVEPIAIYRGSDAQFGDMSGEDRLELASYMRTQFTDKLRRRFTIATDPAPNTLRLKLTLTGATENTPVVSTFTHLDLAGNLYNGIQSIRGREGMMSGSVTYAVEIYDASTNRLLSAFISKQYPNAMNVMASFGSLGAAKTGIEKGAEALVDYLK
ncbi:MAG: DUF3313 domain-containing protein [Proteobacteria bacterium]|nr:DUF3313 domain-containing protein [Pseudomonadota bacterium]